MMVRFKAEYGPSLPRERYLVVANFGVFLTFAFPNSHTPRDRRVLPSPSPVSGSFSQEVWRATLPPLFFFLHLLVPTGCAPPPLPFPYPKKIPLMRRHRNIRLSHPHTIPRKDSRISPLPFATGLQITNLRVLPRRSQGTRFFPRTHSPVLVNAFQRVTVLQL